jgi:hypothetical protein
LPVCTPLPVISHFLAIMELFSRKRLRRGRPERRPQREAGFYATAAAASSDAFALCPEWPDCAPRDGARLKFERGASNFRIVPTLRIGHCHRFLRRSGLLDAVSVTF